MFSLSVLSSFGPTLVPRHTGPWWQTLYPPQPSALEPQNPPPWGQCHPPSPPIPHPPSHWPMELHLSWWRKLRWWPKPKPLGQQPSGLPALPYQPFPQLWPLPLTWLRPIHPQGWPLECLGHSLTIWPILCPFSHLPFCTLLHQWFSHAALFPHSTPQSGRLSPHWSWLGGLQQTPGWHQRESSSA